MPTLEVLTTDNDPKNILGTPASEVIEINSPEVLGFIDNLTSTFGSLDGCLGLAAPQVGKLWRIMMISSRPSPPRFPDEPIVEPFVLINPEIISYSTIPVTNWEGCFSIPNKRGKVTRPDWVKVRYIDRGYNVVTKIFTGLLARVFLHEFDHLNGILFTDLTQEICTEDEFQKRVKDGTL